MGACSLRVGPVVFVVLRVYATKRAGISVASIQSHKFLFVFVLFRADCCIFTLLLFL